MEPGKLSIFLDASQSGAPPWLAHRQVTHETRWCADERRDPKKVQKSQKYRKNRNFRQFGKMIFGIFFFVFIRKFCEFPYTYEKFSY
jgi:hypothetical protein